MSFPFQRTQVLLSFLSLSLLAVPVKGQLVCNGPTVDFTSGIPASWDLGSASGTSTTWGSASSCSEPSNYVSASGGDFLCAASAQSGPSSYDTWIVSERLDLGGVLEKAQLEFATNAQLFEGADELAIEVSADGGAFWTRIDSLTRDHGAFRAPPGTPVEVDLSAWVGQSDVRVRWRYRSLGDEALGWYAQIDDVALTCDPAPLCGSTESSIERIVDGGFEDASAWTASSLRFSTPFCDAGSCGLQGAAEGDAWAFFGGFDGAEEIASVEQSILLHPSQAILRMQLWAPRDSGNATDDLRVLLDGLPVFSLGGARGAYRNGYRDVVIDLRAHADGGVHILRLEAETSGLPRGSQFFVDDLRLEGCTNSSAAPEIRVLDASFFEGDTSRTIEVLVTLSHAESQDVVVDLSTLDGSAIASADFVASTQTVVIPAGATEAAASLTLVGDLFAEGVESFDLVLSNALAGVIVDERATVTILDEDADLTIDDVEIQEGDYGPQVSLVPVLLQPASSREVSVQWSTQSGTATAGEDFSVAEGILTFPAGTTERILSVRSFGDLLAEGDEGFQIVLSQPSGAHLSRPLGQVTLRNDDVVEISIDPATVAEGHTGKTTVLAPVRLSRPSARSITASYATADGQALEGFDYVATSGQLTIPAGEMTASIPVEILGDEIDEDDEGFTVQISNPQGAELGRSEAIVMIVDDDTLEVSVLDASLIEGNAGSGLMTFQVELSLDSTEEVAVDFSTRDGTATASQDYVAAEGTILFPPGTTTRQISVEILGDTLDEEDESLRLVLSNARGVTLGRSTAVGTIVNDDGAVADAGGPYFTSEGTPVSLDGSGSVDPNGSIALWQWDLDEDGSFDDAEGQTASWTFLDDGVWTVSLRVTGEDGSVSIDQSDVTVANEAPTVVAPDSEIELSRGATEELRVHFSDAGLEDTHEATIDWGDATAATEGRILASGSGLGVVSGFHRYEVAGSYSAEVCVSDDDGGRTCVRFDLVVNEHQDLTIDEVDATTLTVDPQSLWTEGTLAVTVRNVGRSPVEEPFSVAVFLDENGDNAWTPGIDTLLGTDQVNEHVAHGESRVLPFAVETSVDFVGDLFHAVVDSDGSLVETNEANNVDHSGARCIRETTIAPEVEWFWKGSDIEPTFDDVVMTPIVGDLTGDGIPEIAFNSRADHSGLPAPGILRVVSGLDGSSVLDLTDLSLRTRSLSQLAIADLDGDLQPEILAARWSPVGLMAIAIDGGMEWFAPGIQPLWGGATISDLDGDGVPEIVVGETVLNADGSIRWKVDDAAGTAYGVASSVADLDLDGDLEVIVGGRAYHHDGSIAFSGGPTGHSAVANFDEDPYPEVVVVSNGTVVLLEHDGSTVWVEDHDLGHGGAPVIADFDGDGRPEIGAAGASKYVVLNGDGTTLWTADFSDASSSFVGSSAFDFDGDGRWEVLARGELNFRILRGSDGATLYEMANPSCTGYEYVSIADIDLDGSAELLVPRDQLCGVGQRLGIPDQGIIALGDPSNRWTTSKTVWNQYAYQSESVGNDLVPIDAARPWLDPHTNTFRSQATVGSAEEEMPNFTSSKLRLHDNACPGELLFTARIGNGGAGATGSPVPAHLYLGDPRNGGALLGVTATEGTLAPGEFADVSWTVSEVVGGGEICVVANDGAAEDECSVEDNVQCIEFASFCQSADIVVEVSDGLEFVEPGTASTYQITVSNHGPDPASVGLAGSLPEDFLDPTWSCVSQGSSTCTVAALGDLDGSAVLEPGGTAGFSAQGTVAPRATGTLVFDVTATGSLRDPALANNVARDETVVATPADLEVVKTDQRSRAEAGSTTTYVITVLNHGPGEVQDGRIEDLLPEDLRDAVWTCVSPNGICANAQGEGDLVEDFTLSAGSRIVYTIHAVIDEQAEGLLRNTVRVSSSQPDPNPANNIAIDETSLADGPDLVVEIDGSELVTDPSSLSVEGDLLLMLRNQGSRSSSVPFDTALFLDLDASGRFENGIDLLLNESIHEEPFGPGEERLVRISVAFETSFAGSPVFAFVDHRDVIEEMNEQNNVSATSADCLVDPVVGDFEPELEWAWTGSDVAPSFDDVLTTPIVGDLTGDGIAEITFSSRENHTGLNAPGILRVIDGRDGSSVLDVTDPALRTSSLSQLAIADLDGDLEPEILAVRWSPSGLMALKPNGDLKWFVEGARPLFGGPTIANVDGEGDAEVVFGATIIGADGTVRWRVDDLGGVPWGSLSSVADLDLDGRSEIIVGGRAFRHDGTLFYSNGYPDGLTAVANFDEDPYPEVVVVESGNIRLQDADGTLLWSHWFSEVGRGGPPTIGDFDGDGEPEIGVAGATHYVVVEGNGTLLWRSPTEDRSSQATGSSLFDFEGDGEVEVVYRDEEYLRVYRGRDGHVLFEVANPSCTGYENPVVADVDGDDNAEIIVPRDQLCGYGSRVGIYDQGLFVFGDSKDNWISTRRVWNQHAYSVKNVEDDLTIPTKEEPSWLVEGLNNYRAQQQVEGARLGPDLVPSALRLDSCEDISELSVRVGNAGELLAGAPVDVAFYAGDPRTEPEATLLGVRQTVVDLARAQFEEIHLPLSQSLEVPRVCVAVDEAELGGIGRHRECREDNNVTCFSIQDLCGTPAPSITATKSDFLLPENDLDGDEAVSVGDHLSYRLEVQNTGSGDAHGVVLSDALPGGTLLVAGSITATRGTVTQSPSTVILDVGLLPAGGDVVLTFDVIIVAGAGQVLENQAIVTASDLLAFGTDDPSTPEVNDPTATVVEALPPELALEGGTVVEADGVLIFHLVLSRAAGSTLTVPWMTAEGTAEAGADFEPGSGLVEIPVGAVGVELSIPITDDSMDEPDETFEVHLGEVSGALVTVASAVGTILDDDEPPVLDVHNTVVNEGDSGEVPAGIEVTLSERSGFDITVQWSSAAVTAEADVDYREMAHGTLIIPAGTSEALLDPAVLGDTVDEDDETFTVRIDAASPAELGDVEAEVTIQDDDTAFLEVEDVEIEEGDTGLQVATVTVRLSTTADWEILSAWSTAAGTATAGTDYEEASGSLSIAAGDSESSIEVTILGDLLLEADETVHVELAEAVGAEIGDGLAEVLILDDEACPGPDLVLSGSFEEPAATDWSLLGMETVASVELPDGSQVQPFEGGAFLAGGMTDFANATQTIPLAVWAHRWLDGPSDLAVGIAVQTAGLDSVEVRFEAWDAQGFVLDSKDFGTLESTGVWTDHMDLFPVPVGTVGLTVRVQGLDGDGNGWIDAFVDSVTVHPLRIPVLLSEGFTVAEPSEPIEALFDVYLSCPIESDLLLEWSTRDGTAADGADYLGGLGAGILPAGATTVQVPTTILPDAEEEPAEHFFLDVLSANATRTVPPESEVLLLEPTATGVIQAPFCPLGHGYWKNHPDAWPVVELELGGVTYGFEELMELLNYAGPDASSKLALQLIAGKLNLLMGSDPSILPVVEAADGFLSAHPPGSNPKGSAKQEGLALKDQLDDYVNMPCESGDEGGGT